MLSNEETQRAGSEGGVEAWIDGAGCASQQARISDCAQLGSLFGPDLLYSRTYRGGSMPGVNRGSATGTPATSRNGISPAQTGVA